MIKHRRTQKFPASDTANPIPRRGTGVKAILDANAAPGADVVEFQGVSGTITLSSGDLQITDDLTINGPGANVLVISGNYARDVFVTVKTVEINDLTITRGKPGMDAGGIYNFGNLTL